MKSLTKIMASAISALTLATCVVAPSSISPISGVHMSFVSIIEANAASVRLYNQNDSSWKNVKFYKYSNSQEEFKRRKHVCKMNVKGNTRMNQLSNDYPEL